MKAKFNPASNKLVAAEIMFDTGSVASQLQLLDSPKSDLTDDHNDDNCDAIAAAAAASEADALLDSIQMPQLGIAVPSAITMMQSVTGHPALKETQSSTVVSLSSEKEDSSSDESLGDGVAKNAVPTGGAAAEDSGVLIRRSSRKKD